MAEGRYNMTNLRETSRENDQASNPNDDSIFTYISFSPSPPFPDPWLPPDSAEVRQEANLVSEDVDTTKPTILAQDTHFRAAAAFSCHDQDARDHGVNQRTAVQVKEDVENLHWSPIATSDDRRGYQHHPRAASTTSGIQTAVALGSSGLSDGERQSDRASGMHSTTRSPEAFPRQPAQQGKDQGPAESFRVVTTSSLEDYLDDAAQQLCTTWLLSYKGIMPKSQHYEALGHLTGYSAESIEHWFGAKLRSNGSSNNDSGYFSGSYGASTASAQNSMPPDTTGQAIDTVPNPLGSHGFDDGTFIKPNQALCLDGSLPILAPSPPSTDWQYLNVDDMSSIPNHGFDLDTPQTMLPSSDPSEHVLTIHAGMHEADKNTSAASFSVARAAALARAEHHFRDRLNKSCHPTFDVTLLVRDPVKPYQCSFKCGKSFARADDLRRHEETKYPQRGSVCLVPREFIVEGERRCGYCDEVNPPPDHFAKSHKTRSRDRTEGEHSFCETYHFRPERFKQHFERLHPHLRFQDYERQGRLNLTTRFPKYCGFCVRRFETWTWKERMRHLCKHFQGQELDMRRWRDEPGQDTQYRKDFHSPDPPDSDDSDDGDDSDDNDDGHGRLNLRRGPQPRFGTARGSNSTARETADPPQGNNSSQQSGRSQQCRRTKSSPHDITDTGREGIDENEAKLVHWPRRRSCTLLPWQDCQLYQSADAFKRPSQLIRYQHYYHHSYPQRTCPFPSTMIASLDTGVQDRFISEEFLKKIVLKNESCSTHNTSLTPNQFSSSGLLGRGGSSVVDRVLHRPTGLVFARKTIRRTPDAERAFENERRFFERLRQDPPHRHFTQLIGSYVQKDSMSMILSPAADMNLSEFMNLPPPVDPSQIVHLWRQLYGLADGLMRIHALGPDPSWESYHNDIKPENILCFRTQHDDCTIFKISDFGMSRLGCPRKSGIKSSANKTITNEAPETHGGTPMYQAPEIALREFKGSQAGDVFSLGCVFLEMATLLLSGTLSPYREYHNKHFQGKKYYHQNITQTHEWLRTLRAGANLADIPKVDIITSMLNRDPRKRPTAYQISRFLPPGPCCQSDLDELKQQAADEELHREAVRDQHPAGQNIHRQNSRKQLRSLSSRLSAPRSLKAVGDGVSELLFCGSWMVQCAREAKQGCQEDGIDYDDGTGSGAGAEDRNFCLVR